MSRVPHVSRFVCVGVFLSLMSVAVAGCVPAAVRDVVSDVGSEIRATLRLSDPDDAPQFGGSVVEGLPEITVEITPEVLTEYRRLASRGCADVFKSLERGADLVSAMRRALIDEGVPRDLLALAIVESGLNLKARSPRGARGPWQFMPATGRMYGLRVSLVVVGRVDPYRSTRAAARYLTALYRRFGDWYLALAAYNAGEGGVLRAMKRSSSTTYWDLVRRNALRRETARFVPKILAVLQVLHNMDSLNPGDPERFACDASSESPQNNVN